LTFFSWFFFSEVSLGLFDNLNKLRCGFFFVDLFTVVGFFLKKNILIVYLTKGLEFFLTYYFFYIKKIIIQPGNTDNILYFVAAEYY